MNDELKQLSSAAHGLLEQAAGATAFRTVRVASDSGFDGELWGKMAELGWAGIAIPEALGGYDMGPEALAVIGEALGAHLASSPFATTAVLAAKALAAGGEGHAERLGRIAAGQEIVAVALDTGSARGPSPVLAVPEGAGFKLSGSLSMVDFVAASSALVWARTSDASTTALVMPTEGLSATTIINVDMRRTSTVSFDGVTVGPEAVVGTVDAGAAVLDKAVDAARVAVAAETVGAAQAVFHQTMAYLRDRKQFGVPIGSFQALQHRAAHLHTELSIAGAVVRKAARALAEGDADAGALVSVAKAKAGKVAILTANEGIQMHGGVGVTDEFDVGLYVKRVRALENTFGDARFHAARLADLRGF